MITVFSSSKMTLTEFSMPQSVLETELRTASKQTWYPASAPRPFRWKLAKLNTTHKHFSVTNVFSFTSIIAAYPSQGSFIRCHFALIPRLFCYMLLLIWRFNGFLKNQLLSISTSLGLLCIKLEGQHWPCQKSSLISINVPDPTHKSKPSFFSCLATQVVGPSRQVPPHGSIIVGCTFWETG